MIPFSPLLQSKSRARGVTKLCRHTVCLFGSRKFRHTENLARKLNSSGKRTSILLGTMGQKKIVNVHILSGLDVSGMDVNDFIEDHACLCDRCPTTKGCGSMVLSEI